MRPPMRSSIACTRCRKSKIKCENTNGTSPCDSCIKTGNECIFKVPDPAPSKRLEPPAVVKQERDGVPDRKRLKRIDDLSRGNDEEITALVEDVLSAPFLTEDLWEQVLDLYKLHFAPELPFLHLPTIKEELGRRSKSSSSRHSSDSNIVLLGILTLTARFHPDLVRYTAHLSNNQYGNPRTRPLQGPPDSTAASKYYADILDKALGPVRTLMSTASVDRVAALLMLGLYEWSQAQPKTGGITAWMYVSNAIRMAQFLGLGFEDADEPGYVKSRAVDIRSKDVGRGSHLALQKEIRRRIMFSCFTLDKMLASGKHRIPIMRGEDLHIQLPCPEDKFDLAIEVQTGRITQLGRTGSDDSVLSRFIQLVNLWGEISKYSSRGGRVQDRHPPWHPQSDFYKLNEALEVFDSSLQDAFTFSRSNYFKHENHLDSSTFVLLHMLRFVSLIMLHREYVPFVPIRCQEPQGPLDQPTVTKEEAPAGFWRSSAGQLFRAARGIVDLIEICQRKDKLPQSTIVLFAIWTAAFVGLYATHFPQMDTEGHMLTFDFQDMREDGLKDVFKRGPTALTFQTLLKMSNWQKMASTYVDILHGMNDYFDAVKEDYYKYSEKNGRADRMTLRLSERGTSGGPEEYQLFMRKSKDFDSPRPHEHNAVDMSERFRIGMFARSPSDIDSSGASYSAPPASFTAINRSPVSANPDLTRPLSRATTGSGLSHMQSEPYAESWRYHGTSQQQTLPSPSRAYLTPISVPDPAATHAPSHEPDPTDGSEHFWDKLHKDELRRFGATGDLSLFSTGEPQVSAADVPFESFPYMPTMSESSYQFLQRTED
ncbi:fungal-specific transcription factor domain-containing protein [Nemania sp. NC0429]|nr:fungal-specific transcription factor domain-containing protein [Nemania sp. NC0429]